MEKKLHREWWAGAVDWLRRRYSWSFLRRDLIAGLTVATVAVPQAMAYALIAGIPPTYGLYTAIVMTALGSIFGSSRFLMNGPTNAISLVVLGAAGVGLAETDGSERLQYVFLLAVLVALTQIDKLLGLESMGNGSDYLLRRLWLTWTQGGPINLRALAIGLAT